MEDIKNKKTKSRGLIILCIILTILLIGSIGYIVYDKLVLDNKISDNKKDKPKAEDKEDVKRSLTDSEQSTLLEQVKVYNASFSDSYPITNIKDLSNQSKLYFAFSNLKLNSLSNFMESDLEKVINKYFGLASEIVYEDIICPIDNKVFFKYDSARRDYSFINDHGHGGSGTYITTNYYVDGNVINEKEIIIDVNIIYSDYCSDTCGPTTGYYKNVNDALNSTNSLFSPTSDEYTFTNSDYQKIKDKLDITRFTFIKDKDGNYGLKSVTII